MIHGGMSRGRCSENAANTRAEEQVTEYTREFWQASLDRALVWVFLG